MGFCYNGIRMVLLGVSVILAVLLENLQKDVITGFSERELWDATFSGRPTQPQLRVTLPNVGGMPGGNWLSRACKYISRSTVDRVLSI